MPRLPFTDDLDPLYENPHAIPVDLEVPFAKEYAALLVETAGDPWGPQATEPSKMATRLHFAGWSRRELEEVGLKPKDVANFRSNRGLTRGHPGRPTSPSEAKSAVAGPLESMRSELARVKREIVEVTQEIEERQELLGQLEKDAAKLTVAVSVLDGTLSPGQAEGPGEALAVTVGQVL